MSVGINGRPPISTAKATVNGVCLFRADLGVGTDEASSVYRTRPFQSRSSDGSGPPRVLTLPARRAADLRKGNLDGGGVCRLCRAALRSPRRMGARLYDLRLPDGSCRFSCIIADASWGCGPLRASGLETTDRLGISTVDQFSTNENQRKGTRVPGYPYPSSS